MGRSLLAVLTGFAVIAGLAVGTDRALILALPSLHDVRGATASVPVLLVTVAYVSLYAVVGGYVSARLSPRRPMRHALAVGALALAFVVAGSVTRWDLAPRWYHLLSVSLIVPTVWLGGRMRVQEVAVAPRSRVGGTATRANARAA